MFKSLTQHIPLFGKPASILDGMKQSKGPFWRGDSPELRCSFDEVKLIINEDYKGIYFYAYLDAYDCHGYKDSNGKYVYEKSKFENYDIAFGEMTKEVLRAQMHFPETEFLFLGKEVKLFNSAIKAWERVPDIHWKCRNASNECNYEETLTNYDALNNRHNERGYCPKCQANTLLRVKSNV